LNRKEKRKASYFDRFFIHFSKIQLFKNFCKLKHKRKENALAPFSFVIKKDLQKHKNKNSLFAFDLISKREKSDMEYLLQTQLIK
jgi:hypothetical protein